MAFKVGDVVVYPHHGACTVKAIEKRLYKGEEREFLVLTVHTGGLEIRLPANNDAYVGLRYVTSPDELEGVFAVLREPYKEESTNWSRRFKANQEKLKSGDILKVAEVVRDLSARQAKSSLSAGEKRMHDHAIKILRMEVALSRAAGGEIDEAEAEELILKQLQTQAA